MDAPALHARIEPLAFLVGSWRGLGVVGYPTIEERRYEQEIVFAHDGRPFLDYTSRTWILDDDGARLRPAAREVEVSADLGTEQGHGVGTAIVEIRPSRPTVVTAEVTDPGGLLTYRQQPLVVDDELALEVPFVVD